MKQRRRIGQVKKMPWSWARVVKASRVLSPIEKLVWLEHVGLANDSEGAFISASVCAGRIGCSRVTVERARQVLLSCGLFVRKDRGSGRPAAWFPTLPPQCRPSRQRIIDDEAERLAELLDVHMKVMQRPRRNGLTDTSLIPRVTLSHERVLDSGRLADGEMSEVIARSHEGGFAWDDLVTDGEDGGDGAELRVSQGEVS